MKKLSYKIALFIGLLIALIVILLSVPIYWQTRQTMEEELSRNLKTNIVLLQERLDTALIGFLNRYPESAVARDSVRRMLLANLSKVSASSIYLIRADSSLLISTGKEESGVKSLMLHSGEISRAFRGEIVCSPLFSDDVGNYLKSTFSPLHLPDSSVVIVAIDASATFLQDAARLQSQMVRTGLIILLLGIFISVLASRNLTKPLGLLTKYAEEIGKGRKQSVVLRNRKDEIGFLGQTMQKMQAEIDRREKENKQLLASVAHEIRNPLGGMKINAELLIEETRNAPELAEFAAAISREVNRLSEIVDAFLAYARPVESNLVESDIRWLLTESINEVQPFFPNHKFIVSGEGSLNVHPGKIQRAFTNCLRNAADASGDSDPIQIEIRKNGQELTISFFNQGMPMPEKIQPQIFDAFFSTKSSGVGLGLSIAKSIVEQHGGSIRLTRSDESGTEFVITLPEQ
ncbi:MAG: HAMP domain-containing sensor histidine kinase [Candidatus Neomarinimicrobiota bacterium]